MTTEQMRRVIRQAYLDAAAVCLSTHHEKGDSPTKGSWYYYEYWYCKKMITENTSNIQRQWHTCCYISYSQPPHCHPVRNSNSSNIRSHSVDERTLFCVTTSWSQDHFCSPLFPLFSCAQRKLNQSDELRHSESEPICSCWEIHLYFSLYSSPSQCWKRTKRPAVSLFIFSTSIHAWNYGCLVKRFS